MKKNIITIAIATSTIIGLGIQNEKIAYGIDIQEKSNIQENDENEILKGTIIDIKTVLRIRKDGNVRSEILGYLEKGKEVDIISRKGNWYEIIENNIHGYICGDYVKINNTIKKDKFRNIDNNSKMREKIFTDNKSKGYAIKEEVNSEEKEGTLAKENNQIYTNYNISIDEYAKIQNEKNPKYSIEYFKEYLNPKQENIIQFLRVDKFRNINRSSLNEYLEKNNVGVLKGQANALIVAAKKKEIDPIYFTALSIYETAYGKKVLAKGLEIKEIADLEKEIKNTKGELIGYKMIQLKNPIIVYNLYGIGEYESSKAFPDRGLITAATYAYNNGWTSISKAIDGAAEFVSNNYIHNSKYEQNTVYKMRYINSIRHMWHQYSTVPWYGLAIAEKMKEMENFYLDKNFIYDRPRFLEKEVDPLDIRLEINKNKLKQSEIHVSIEDDIRSE